MMGEPTYSAGGILLKRENNDVFIVIVEWENKGAQLELAGRGDALPKSIDSLISIKDKSSFTELLESAVEVGITDMYGAETENPTLYLKKCIAILNKNKITTPKIDENRII